MKIPEIFPTEHAKLKETLEETLAFSRSINAPVLLRFNWVSYAIEPSDDIYELRYKFLRGLILSPIFRNYSIPIQKFFLKNLIHLNRFLPSD